MENTDLKILLNRQKSYYVDFLHDNFGVFQFKKPVVLFGAAQMGGTYLSLCKKNKINVLAFADNNRERIGKKLDNKNIISISELMRFPKDTQIIISSIYDKEIRLQLKKIGFTRIWPHSFFSTLYPRKFNNPYWQNSLDDIFWNKDDILTCFDLLADSISKKTFLELIKYRLFLDGKFIKKISCPQEKEYFDKDIIHLSTSEIFVDGGAYDGDTIEKFKKVTNDKFSSIYAFEPDQYMHKKLKQNLKKLRDSRIKIYPYGLGKNESYVNFTNDSTLGSRITTKGSLTIKLKSLDAFFLKKKISLIKLDVEGAEGDVLKGGKKVLIKYMPKLAVCVYHKSTDLWRIPLLIKKYIPDYTFYLRHYGQFIYDTVCYAVI